MNKLSDLFAHSTAFRIAVTVFAAGVVQLSVLMPAPELEAETGIDPLDRLIKQGGELIDDVTGDAKKEAGKLIIKGSN